MSFRGNASGQVMKKGQLCTIPELGAAVGIAGKLRGGGHAPRV